MTEDKEVKKTKNIVHYKEGSLVVAENDVSRKMYIITEGKVRVYKNYLGSKITLAVLGRGEIFGELSFFDSEPRSASVEAISDVSLVVLDAEKSSSDIESLPRWVLPVIKTVLHRFREADQKIILLQSMYEFQKKSIKSDKVAQTIYTELLRFIKTFKMLCTQYRKDNVSAHSEKIYKELDDLLGRKYLNFKIFSKMLSEYDFIDTQEEKKNKIISIKMDNLDKFYNYLEMEIKENRFLFLNHSSIAILKRIIAHHDKLAKRKKEEKQPEKIVKNEDRENFLKELNGKEENKIEEKNEDNVLTIKYEEITINAIPLYKDAINELVNFKIINTDQGKITVNLDIILNVFIYQTILKSFDHMTFSTD